VLRREQRVQFLRHVPGDVQEHRELLHIFQRLLRLYCILHKWILLQELRHQLQLFLRVLRQPDLQLWHLRRPAIPSPITISFTQPIAIPFTQPIAIPFTQPIAIPFTQPIAIPFTQTIAIPFTQPQPQPSPSPSPNLNPNPNPKPISAATLIHPSSKRRNRAAPTRPHGQPERCH
jgi:hypothetical protein